MKIAKGDRVMDPALTDTRRVDPGTIMNITDGQAEVRWDSGTMTVQPVDSLKLIGYPTNITPGTPGYVGYPKNDQYQWGEFAFAAIELGGYSDMSLVDPMTGTRLWVGEILSDGPTWSEALHRLAAAAEQTNFFEVAGDPRGLREEARIGRAPTEQENRRAAMRIRHQEERDAMMRRHVEERNAVYGDNDPPVAVLGEPAGAEGTGPDA